MEKKTTQTLTSWILDWTLEIGLWKACPDRRTDGKTYRQTDKTTKSSIRNIKELNNKNNPMKRYYIK